MRYILIWGERETSSHRSYRRSSSGVVGHDKLIFKTAAVRVAAATAAAADVAMTTQLARKRLQVTRMQCCNTCLYSKCLIFY